MPGIRCLDLSLAVLCSTPQIGGRWTTYSGDHLQGAVVLSTCHPTTIDRDALATDIVTGCASKEDSDTPEIFGRTPATCRDPFENLARPGRIRDESFVHLQRAVGQFLKLRDEKHGTYYIGGDVPWCNAIHINTARGPFIRQSLGLSDRVVVKVMSQERT
jgi:hypothetical protein